MNEEKGVMGEAAQLQRTRSLGSVIREKDEELALFFEMRKRERDTSGSLLLDSPVELDPLPGSKQGSSPIFKFPPSVPSMKAVTDDFLNSNSEKNDYDWLLTPPGTPLFPYLEKESKPTSQISAPKARAALLKLGISNPPDAFSKGSAPSKQPQSSGPNASTMAIRRPLSSGGLASVSTKSSSAPNITLSGSSGSSGPISSKPSSRPATPTNHSVIPVMTKSSTSSTKSSMSSMPSTTRSSLPVKSNGPRSGTTSRPSTHATRSSFAPSKSSSRGPTPPRQSSAPTLRNSGSSTQLLAKPNSVAIAARSSSPAAKFLPPKPSEFLGVPKGAMSNSTSTTIPGRPASASRGRSGPPSSRSLSADPIPGCKMRRKSCSPSRGRAPNGSITHSGSSVPAIIRSHVDNSDDVNPVLMGTMMVERVINSRRLMPPKQDRLRSSHGNVASKTGYPDSSGFGRMLSKKSLDMALRHMDIRKYP